MGEGGISSWRTIPALGFSDHVTIEFNLGWESLNATSEDVRQRSAAKETKFCYAKAIWERFNYKFDKAYRDYVDAPRKRRIKKGKSSRDQRYRFVTRARSNPTELENRRISAAFQIAMKTPPQGCRQDPVPWWDKDIDDAIILRERLRKIRDDKTASPTTLEQRWLNHKLQADITRELIRTKRAASWQRFATDNLRYTADSRRTAAMIQLLARTERPSPLQTLEDKSNRV